MADKIEINFLGTGSAVPTKRRNHSGILLKYKEQNFLFDCGEGIQRQFRLAELNPCKITKIFITHWHGDHFLGLPGLLQTLEMNSYNKILEIYGPKGIKKNISDVLSIVDKKYLLQKRKNSSFYINVNEIAEGTIINEKEYKVEALSTFHLIPSLAYSFIVKQKNRIDKEKLEKLKIGNSPLVGKLSLGEVVEINGKKIDGKKLIYTEDPKKITLILDTKFDKQLISFASKSNLLVCESTYKKDEQQIADEYFHLTNIDCANIAKKSNSEKLILTHLSQRNDEIPKILEKEAKEIFKNVKVAEDFDKIEF